MCGIAGVVSNTDLHISVLEKMLQKVLYRGRDNHDIKLLNGAGFAHARLSIVDLSEQGNQPMFDSSGRYCIVFNGEIYGFQKIRDELLSGGVSLKSTSDTEVLLEGFKLWGVQKLCTKINGMFAFAIWDNFEQKLVLVRDRLGEKPLFTYNSNGSFYFASNIQAIFAGISQAPVLNEKEVYKFLHYGYVSPGSEFIIGVQEVLPGEYWEVDSSGIKKHRYYKYSITENSQTRPVNDHISILSDTLQKVVEEEMVADVSVGCLLSGGVDSSLIAYYASKIKKIDAFTVAMPYGINEADIAANTARHLNIKHHIIKAEIPDEAEVEKLLQTFSYPLGDSSALGMYMVSKAAAKEVKVLLTGDGGDEFFAGYDSIKIHYRYKKYKSILNNQIGNYIREVFNNKYFLESEKLRKLSTFFNITTQSALEYHVLRGHLPEFLVPLNLHIRGAAKMLGDDNLNRLLEFDVANVLPGDFIPKVDITTMLNNIEARSPFLHPDIVKLTEKMDIDIKRYGGESKGILKKLLIDKVGNEVSAPIIRGKRGFVLPVDKLLFKDTTSAAQYILKSNLLKNGIIEPKLVKDVFYGSHYKTSLYSRLRYSLFALVIWYDQF